MFTFDLSILEDIYELMLTFYQLLKTFSDVRICKNRIKKSEFQSGIIYQGIQ